MQAETNARSKFDLEFGKVGTARMVSYFTCLRSLSDLFKLVFFILFCSLCFQHACALQQLSQLIDSMIHELGDFGIGLLESGSIVPIPTVNQTLRSYTAFKLDLSATAFALQVFICVYVH